MRNLTFACICLLATLPASTFAAVPAHPPPGDCEDSTRFPHLDHAYDPHSCLSIDHGGPSYDRIICSYVQNQSRSTIGDVQVAESEGVMVATVWCSRNTSVTAIGPPGSRCFRDHAWVNGTLHLAATCIAPDGTKDTAVCDYSPPQA